MAMRWFGVYLLVELAVVIALAATIGVGWTLLVLLATFLLGIALAGSQMRRQLDRLRQGVNSSPQGAQTRAADGMLVALGTVLVFVPGLVSTVAGLLMLMPPTRAAVRPLAGFVVARGITRRMAFVDLTGVPTAAQRPGRGDYIDGEVIDAEVVDVADTPAASQAAVPAVGKPE